MRHCIVACMLVLFLNGCAGSGAYQLSSQEGSEMNASLKGNVKREGLFHYDLYSIDAVDNKAVSHLLEGAEKEVQILPGEHTIVVHAMFNRTLGGSCPCETRLALTAKFEPQKNYILNGKVDGATISAWIEEVGTSQKVSEVVAQPYRSAPQDTYVYIPSS